LGVLTGIIGCMQANEVIKIILGFENVLSGTLYCYNAKTNQTTTLKITKSKSEFKKVLALKDNFQDHYIGIFCESEVDEISIEEALEKENVQFIDVREYNEKPKLDLPNCYQIPLEELENNLDQINSENNNILFCQTGIRSKTAVEILQNHGIVNCYSLKGGALAIIEPLKSKI